MTREELKQEAEEKLLQAELDYCHELSNPCEPSELPYSELLRFETGYKRGYLASAEPREKRIAELEKELEQAKKVQVVEHFEAYGQCRDSRRIASLEAENEKLKEQNIKFQKILTEDFIKDVSVSMEYADKLEQAKEHIRTLISCLINWVQEGDKDYCYITEAEQFLKESE